MIDYIEIGSEPADEEALPAGSDRNKQKAVCETYIAAIKAKLGEPPAGARLAIKWNSHDFGQYAEVICYYDDDNEKATDYAFKCQSDAPLNWGECADLGVKPPRDDTDPAFAASELIPVPENGLMYSFPPTVCDLQESAIRSPRCRLQNLGNEFYDAALAIGSWANVCPECFNKNGIGVGTGKGQHYRKATDGNFYCVEGR